MSTNRYKYFRWTPRTALITINYMVVVPTILTVIAYSTEVCTCLRRTFLRVTGEWTADFLVGTGQVGLPGKEERRPDLRILDESDPRRAPNAAFGKGEEMDQKYDLIDQPMPWYLFYVWIECCFPGPNA